MNRQTSNNFINIGGLLGPWGPGGCGPYGCGGYPTPGCGPYGCGGNYNWYGPRGGCGPYGCGGGYNYWNRSCYGPGCRRW